MENPISYKKRERIREMALFKENSHQPKQTLLVLLLGFIVLLGIIGVFALTMTTSNHNEHMYITATVLASQGKTLYQDFAYLQTPYLPLLYGGIFKTLGITSHYLLVGKGLSFLFIIISALSMFLISRHVFNDMERSLCIVILFLFNMRIINAAAEASNYGMSMMFSLIGTCIFLTTGDDDKNKHLKMLFSGIMLSISAGAKLTYATVTLPFILIICLQVCKDKSTDVPIMAKVTGALLPFIGGLFMGLLPAACYLWNDSVSFVFNNVRYHNIHAHWRHLNGFTDTMTLFSKLTYARTVYFTADNLTIIMGILLGISITMNCLKDIRTISRKALFAGLLSLVGVLTALVPTPSNPQYYAMPMSFLLLMLIYSNASNTETTSTLHKKVLLILTFVTVAYNSAVFAKCLSRLAHRNNWTALTIHDASLTVRNTLAEKTLNKNPLVATLSPLYAVEGNLSVYNELSSGPFLYRIGDLLTSEERKHFTGTSPKTIDSLFSERKPSAIVAGFEGDSDQPLINYALQNNYREISLKGIRGKGKLYIRPSM